MKQESLSSVFAPANYLVNNLEVLKVLALSRDEIDAAEPRGVIRRMADLTPVLDIDGIALGMPLPREELTKSVGEQEHDSVIVVFGLGLGHLIRELRRRCTAPIIVYEPEPGLAKTVLSCGPLDLADIPIVTNSHDLNAAWARVVKQRRSATIVNTPGYRSRFPEEHALLKDFVLQLVQRMHITGNTYRKRARTWVSDVLQNVELLAENPPFLSLQGCYKDVPAFIIGAGPSLDKNIAHLRRAHGKGLVIATNSSTLALGKHDIDPHAIACIESIDISDRLKTLPAIDRCIRAFSLSASPKTLRTGKGPLLPIYEAIPQYSLPLQELTGVPGVAICGSVSTAAFSLAHQLGCNPIVLVGQDMAFTQGQTYATGTGYESSKAVADVKTGRIELDWNSTIQSLHGAQHGERHTSEPLLEMKAWGGTGTVMTGPSFQAINTWFKDGGRLLLEANPALRLINATEGGASIDGWQEQTLEDLLDSLPDLNISVEDIVQAARAKSPGYTLDEIGAWTTRQSSLTRQTWRNARRLRKLAGRALKAIESDEPKRITRAFRALDKAEHELKSSVARTPLIDAWSHASVDDLVRRESPPPAQGLKATAQASIHLGNDVANAIEHSARELENTLNDLAGRLLQPTGTTKGTSPCRC